MRCLINVPTHTTWNTYRGRNGKRYQYERWQMTAQIETTVYRLIRPKTQSKLEAYVWVDAWIPENRRAGIPLLDSNWIEPGVYRTKALLKKNRRTLAPFLASGLEEMNVREVE